MLLAVETKEAQLDFINDNTVEGAVVLAEKIGHMIDEKLASGEADGEESKKSTKKNVEAESAVKEKI
jgi:hypothetical protein